MLRAYEALALTVAIERAPVVLRLVAHAGDAATAEFLRVFAADPRNEAVAELVAGLLREGVGPDPATSCGSSMCRPANEWAPTNSIWLHDYLQTRASAHMAFRPCVMNPANARQSRRDPQVDRMCTRALHA